MSFVRELELRFTEAVCVRVSLRAITVTDLDFHWLGADYRVRLSLDLCNIIAAFTFDFRERVDSRSRTLKRRKRFHALEKEKRFPDRRDDLVGFARLYCAGGAITRTKTQWESIEWENRRD